jgi:hypothetical protein
MGRPMLDHVLLGDQPGESPWSRATGRVYDIRADAYGEGDYSITVNRDRIGRGSTGWMCFRDGSFGFVAGMCVFTAEPEAADRDGIVYSPGIIYPFPREYWIDGARVQLSPDWSMRAPFKPSPNRFKNGESLKPGDVSVLLSLVAEPVRIWREATLKALRASQT